MSFQAINIQDYIDRITKIYQSDTGITSLVTKVIPDKPAVIGESDEGLLPYILVFESPNGIRFLKKIGRDSRDTEGGSLYEAEISTVVVMGTKLNTQLTQQALRPITQAMRNALSRNLRLIDPDTSDDPLATTHTRVEVPYFWTAQNPTLMAQNVLVRPQIIVSPRG